MIEGARQPARRRPPSFAQHRAAAGGQKPTILLLHYTGLPTVERKRDRGPVAARLQGVLPLRRRRRWPHHPDGRRERCAPGTRAFRFGRARRTSTPPPSASRSRTRATRAATRISPRRRCAPSIALSRDIIARHAIAAARVLAHSDVAPARKIDPGEKFDWPGLAEAGIGHWVPPAPLDDGDPGLARGRSRDRRGPGAPRRLRLWHRNQWRFSTRPTRSVVRAFQLHFRPGRIDGRLDRSTVDTLARLLAALPVA